MAWPQGKLSEEPCLSDVGAVLLGINRMFFFLCFPFAKHVTKAAIVSLSTWICHRVISDHSCRSRWRCWPLGGRGSCLPSHIQNTSEQTGQWLSAVFLLQLWIELPVKVTWLGSLPAGPRWVKVRLTTFAVNDELHYFTAQAVSAAITLKTNWQLSA